MISHATSFFFVFQISTSGADLDPFAILHIVMRGEVESNVTFAGTGVIMPRFIFNIRGRWGVNVGRSRLVRIG